MPFKKIIKNLYLGDQFSNKLKIVKELKVADVYYDILNNNDEFIIKNDEFILTDNKLAIKIFDTHSVSDFNHRLFAYGIKFIQENIQDDEIYTHCQLGLSRSSSMIFIYLVISEEIKESNFQAALKKFIDQYYPFMKVNLGVYRYLKNNFPFHEVKELSKKGWDYFLNQYYIDFDWNTVNLYKNTNLIAKEKAIVLKDLITEKVMYLDDAWNHLRDNYNFLNCVLVENRKILDQENFELFLNNYLKKHHLEDKNYFWVNRYSENFGRNNHVIEEKEFLKLFFKERYYLDLRNNEIIIFDQQTNQLKIICQGKVEIIKSLARYFYINFTATLNSQKSKEFLDKLMVEKVDQVLCRSFETGQDKWVEIKSYSELLKTIIDLNQLVQKNLNDYQSVYQTKAFREVFDLCERY